MHLSISEPTHSSAPSCARLPAAEARTSMLRTSCLASVEMPAHSGPSMLGCCCSTASISFASLYPFFRKGCLPDSSMKAMTPQLKMSTCRRLRRPGRSAACSNKGGVQAVLVYQQQTGVARHHATQLLLGAANTAAAACSMPSITSRCSIGHNAQHKGAHWP